jgi:hypothetical protein
MQHSGVKISAFKSTKNNREKVCPFLLSVDTLDSLGKISRCSQTEHTTAQHIDKPKKPGHPNARTNGFERVRARTRRGWQKGFTGYRGVATFEGGENGAAHQ